MSDDTAFNMDMCTNCESEDCLSCLDRMATRRLLNLQEIEEVLIGYGLQPYEIDSLIYRFKEKMNER